MPDAPLEANAPPIDTAPSAADSASDAVFDRLLALARQPAPDPGVVGQLAIEAHAELRFRQNLRQRRGCFRDATEASISRFTLKVRICMILASAVIFLILAFTYLPAAGIPIVVVVLIVFSISLLEFRRSVPPPHSACPGCNYDLTGLPDAIPVAWLRGERIGPDGCPECGTRWPSVPRPPVDSPTSP